MLYWDQHEKHYLGFHLLSLYRKSKRFGKIYYANYPKQSQYLVPLRTKRNVKWYRISALVSNRSCKSHLRPSPSSYRHTKKESQFILYKYYLYNVNTKKTYKIYAHILYVLLFGFSFSLRYHKVIGLTKRIGSYRSKDILPLLFFAFECDQNTVR